MFGHISGRNWLQENVKGIFLGNVRGTCSGAMSREKWPNSCAQLQVSTHNMDLHAVTDPELF